MAARPPSTDQLAVRRRAQIVRSAAVVIARSGADGARLKDVADEAGVSLGLVQHYFGTRQALVESTFRSMMELSVQAWDAIADVESDPLVRLMVLLRLQVHGPVSFTDRWGFWVELWSLARRHETIAGIAHDVYRQWTEPFRSAVSDLAASGSARLVTSPERTALLILSIVDGLALRALVDRAALDVEGVSEALVEATTTLLSLDPATARAAQDEATAIVDRSSIHDTLMGEQLEGVLQRNGA